MTEVEFEDLEPGDLVRVEWFDASIGKSSAGAITVPVKSWGIYVAVLGKKNRHVVLAQNHFEYSDGLYDVDYTAIPAGWTVKVAVVGREEVGGREAALLLKSFLAGRCRTLKRRTRNHETVD